MLVFLNSKRMMGVGMLTMEITVTTTTIVAPETRVLKVLPNLEIKIVIAMETKGNLKESFLLLHLGLITSLTLAKVAIAYQKNVRSILKNIVSVVA
jgi:DNA-binding XRE family transcriptional regulator